MRPRPCLLLIGLTCGLFSRPALAGIDRWLSEIPVEGQPLQDRVYVLPDELHEAYGFWARVYTEWSSRQALIHLDRSYQIRLDELGQPLLYDTSSDFVRDYNNHELLAEARAQGRPEYWRMQRGMSDVLLIATQTYWFFRDAMEAELRAEGVPVEALALGFLESLYTPDARSTAGAVGVFQLQAWEGRRHGARLGAVYNELLDPIASARIMAKKLKADHALLRRRLDEAGVVDRDASLWPLVITGYNQGIQSVVDAALAAKRARYVELVFADRTGRFGFAGRNFYAQFRLFVDFLQRSRAPLERSGWPRLDGTVELGLGAFVDWPQLMRTCKLHPAWMQPINMGLTELAWEGVLRVPPEVRVRVPVEVMPRFKRCLAADARAALYERQRGLAVYRLQAGDNLSAVAARLGTTPFALMQVNGIDRGQAARLAVGTPVKIPTRRFADLADRVEQWARRGRPRPASFVLVTVQKRQRVEELERRFGLAHPELAKWNDLSSWRPGVEVAVPLYTP